ncbi:flagellin, partial [Clostridium botulinum]|nr:flagellin [Clostridium botulinum]
KMRGQIRGLNQASRNSQDAISLIQTAEGALNETHSILQRMRELTVQAANDTNVTVDRENLQKEVAELQSEINRISSQTQFNTKSLINGAVSKDADAMTFQIGANSGQTIKLTIGSMDAKTLNVDKIKLDDTAANVTKQIATIDNAINSVSKERAKLGANQNRLEHTIANLDNSAENLQAAESRIRDVDMAKEMMNFTKT